MGQHGVVIIGGAIIGSMAAYFLRSRGYDLPIVVVERDPTYARSSTALSAASIRTQFGCPVNVEMSLFGAAFFKSLKARFGPDADIGFRENGYLILGVPGREADWAEAARMQQAAGASVEVLDPGKLADRFGWLNTDDVGVGSFGFQNEGWFDAWSLLGLVRAEARRLGVTYITASAIDIECDGSAVVAVQTDDGQRFAADWIVNAGGPAAARIASWIGADLPVAPKKRTAFSFRADLDGRDMPMLFDASGVWMRPEGNGFIGGIGPQGDDPDADGDFEPDHSLFEEHVWPLLARRVPKLESLRLERAWAGHYEMNTFDHNGIIGPHDTYENFLFACGFSGHGVMHSPATGRAIAEWIVDGKFTSLDVTDLGYDRIRRREPLHETIVY